MLCSATIICEDTQKKPDDIDYFIHPSPTRTETDDELNDFTKEHQPMEQDINKTN